MTNEEKRWEWEVVEEGVSGGQITVEITPESVESYADAVRNTNSRYYGANNGDIAMPTNIFSDAKLRRHSVAEAAGFTALEKCINNPRQTPFAKCTARWFEAIKVGDIIISEPNALIGFAGARVIKQTIGEDLPEGFQRSEFLLKKGFIDHIVSRNEMKDTISNLIEFLIEK